MTLSTAGSKLINKQTNKQKEISSSPKGDTDVPGDITGFFPTLWAGNVTANEDEEYFSLSHYPSQAWLVWGGGVRHRFNIQILTEQLGSDSYAWSLGSGANNPYPDFSLKSQRGKTIPDHEPSAQFSI